LIIIIILSAILIADILEYLKRNKFINKSKRHKILKLKVVIKLLKLESSVG